MRCAASPSSIELNFTYGQVSPGGVAVPFSYEIPALSKRAEVPMPLSKFPFHLIPAGLLFLKAATLGYLEASGVKSVVPEPYSTLHALPVGRIPPDC